MRSFLRAPCLALALALTLPALVTAQETVVIEVPRADPEMAEALAKARASLPAFWEKFEKPGPDEDGFALKVVILYGANNREHIWTNQIERKSGAITAVINNDPVHTTAVKRGQRITVSEDAISDWMYRRSGKIVGNFTMRPMLKRMPAEQAARYRATLAEP